MTVSQTASRAGASGLGGCRGSADRTEQPAESATPNRPLSPTRCPHAIGSLRTKGAARSGVWAQELRCAPARGSRPAAACGSAAEQRWTHPARRLPHCIAPPHGLHRSRPRGSAPCLLAGGVARCRTSPAQPASTAPCTGTSAKCPPPTAPQHPELRRRRPSLWSCRGHCGLSADIMGHNTTAAAAAGSAVLSYGESASRPLTTVEKRAGWHRPRPTSSLSAANTRVWSARQGVTGMQQLQPVGLCSRTFHILANHKPPGILCIDGAGCCLVVTDSVNLPVSLFSS